MLKFITVLVFLMIFGCSANEDGFVCISEFNANVSAKKTLIEHTKSLIVFQAVPPEVEFYTFEESYGSVLLTFNVDDKGIVQNVVVESECPRRVFTKLSKDTLNQFEFQKAQPGATYSAAVVITFK